LFIKEKNFRARVFGREIFAFGLIIKSITEIEVLFLAANFKKLLGHVVFLYNNLKSLNIGTK
jgi:hypothetical protein